MSHTAYWITPDDVAVYLFLENTSHQRENEILWDLFENHKAHIPTEYGSTYLQFKQSVMNLLNIYELDAVSYDEAALILMETEHTSLYSEEESDCFDLAAIEVFRHRIPESETEKAAAGFWLQKKVGKTDKPHTAGNRQAGAENVPARICAMQH